ncbi:MAG: FkbM family methyltransferase [Cephaloticoccus sp.]|nr:FkbM family methyltransferase [Cephaloticoccus sp.]
MLKTKQKMQLARLVQVIVQAARRVAGRGTTTQVRRRGVTWALDLREGIDFSLWLLGAFEPETISCYQRLIHPGDVVLDIGANIGAHTLHLARATGPQGRVIAFEPTDFAFAKLQRNVGLNPELAARIHCLQLMLVAREADGSPTEDLYSSWPLDTADANRHHLHQGRLMTTAGARARALDLVVAELGLERIDCIKLDIDGAECAMLRGAADSLRRWHPAIVMELAPYVLEEKGSSLAELVGILRYYGYRLYDATSGEPLPEEVSQLNAQIPAGASLNVVARTG